MKHAGLSAVVLVLLGVLAAQSSRADLISCKDAEAKEFIDLGEPQADPRALQQVREQRAGHYANIIGLMGSFLSLAPPFDPAVAEQRYGAKEICAQQILPTLPPKIVLQFTMDELRYRVTLRRVAPPAPN